MSANKLRKFAANNTAGTQTRWLGASRSIASGSRPFAKRYTYKVVKMRLYFLILLSCLSPSLLASDESKYLRDFQSEEFFESYLQEIKSDCLGKSMGGSRAVPCFSAYSEAWDNELNYYYGLLRSALSEENRELLKSAQLAWIKSRDAAIAFNSSLLDKKYEEKQGTMYVAMRAGDASRSISPIIKNRALLVKQWYESVVNAK